MNQVHRTLLKQLKEPFDPKYIKWRIGATSADKTKGIALPYIDAREVKKRLDAVMGITNWKDELQEVKDGFIDTLSLRIDSEWIPRAGVGENSHMSPIKGGASDAFKRAASKWGIGHYLYYLPQVWVAIRPQGKSYVLAEIPELPTWALPDPNIENWEDVAELESEASSGEDEMDIVDVDNLDLIRDAVSLENLDLLLESFTPNQKVMFANEIQAKQRELNHAAEIHTDNS